LGVGGNKRSVGSCTTFHSPVSLGILMFVAICRVAIKLMKGKYRNGRKGLRRASVLA